MQHDINRQPLYVLAGFTVLCVLVLVVRNAIVGNSIHNSLFWNLFLGVTPFLIALLITKFQARWNDAVLFTIGAVWLVFYPNAPYIISDFIHIRADQAAIAVYDALVIFLFAMLSFYYGLYSLKMAWKVLFQRFSSRLANAIILFCIVLASLGFYLGRVVRLNSWDIFTHPLKVLVEIWSSLFPVSEHWSAYAMIALFIFAQLLVLLATHAYEKIK